MISSRLAVSIALVFATSSLRADPPAQPAALEAVLGQQKAMVQARAFLRMDESKKAVDILEQQLSKANGNTNFLELLRDAYRAYIKDLHLKNQSAEAQRYLQRLLILDPAAANDPSLRPVAEPKFQPVAREVKPAQPMPNFNETFGKPRTPKIDVQSSNAKNLTARAKADLPQDDPFDPANQRVPTLAADSAGLVSKAHEEFDRARYDQARRYYEQAVQIDGAAIEKVRDRLAYCNLNAVVDQLNGNTATPMVELQKQVRTAMAMAPRLSDTGNRLLKQIDERARTTIAGSMPDAIPDPPLNLRHFGKNPQGWMVTETTHFRVFHNQNRELIERAALIAERTRAAMFRKWFGNEGVEWSPKCEVVIHNSAADYSQQTKQSSTSPGHSRIETDPTTLRVIGRRIDLHVDAFGFLEAVLPHETTHIVLSGNFGQHQVPRWADEGVAVLTEPAEKVDQHRKNLLRGQKEGLLMPVRDLMNLQNYPEPRRISAFYAQSVILVEFLTMQRGPNVFTDFLRDGLQSGYEPALRKHYGWSFPDLQAHWDRQVVGESQRLASRQP